MKNFYKRITSLILAIAILALVVLPVSATSYHEAEANALHELGLFEGINPDTFEPALDQKLDRMQGVTMLLRLLAKEDEALAIPDDEAAILLEQYTDSVVEDGGMQDWSVSRFAYAVDSGLVIGTTDTTLSPADSLEGNAYCTMILRNIGYPVVGDEYFDACELLESKGVIGAGDYADNLELTRDDAVMISIFALLAVCSDGETIGEKLINEGIFTREQADTWLVPLGIVIPSGVITTEPVLKVDPVMDAIKADKSSSVLVKFELRDSTGKLITDKENVKVMFTTTLGSFDNKVFGDADLVDGVATRMLTSEYVSNPQMALIRGTINAADDTSLLNISTTMELLFDPTIMPTTGAAMLSAESHTADRVIAKFDRVVSINDYINKDTKLIDTTKCDVVVRKNSSSATTGTEVVVKGLMPMTGDASALQIMLDVDEDFNNALQDNVQTYVSFRDKTFDAPVYREQQYNFMDVVRPSIVDVEAVNYYTLKVTFSEPIYHDEMSEYSVTNLNNWKLDGTLLTNAEWGITTLPFVDYGIFDPLTGVDKRNTAIIRLGYNGANQVALPGGTHSVSAFEIGDWAEPNDRHNNDIDPEQNVDFEVVADVSIPQFTVQVQSPEQYVLTLDKDTAQTEVDVANNLRLQKFDDITRTWMDVAGGGSAGVVAPYGSSYADDGKIDLVVTKARDINGKYVVADEINKGYELGNTFVVEVDDDWSRVLSSTGRFYYSDTYRLKVAGDTVKSKTNGAGNVESNLVLSDAMVSYDLSSPIVESIAPTLGMNEGTAYNVFLSEPVKFDYPFMSEGWTPSLDQQASGWIHIPVVKFINKNNPNKVVNGFIGRVDGFDKVFTAYTQNGVKLEAGTWLLELSNCSDDFGNTLSSAPKEFVVSDTTGFRVMWFFADVDQDKMVEDNDSVDDDVYNDYVYVKFSEPLKVTGGYDSALDMSNYQINGRALPDDANIVSHINGFDESNQVSSVTIKLPDGYLLDLKGTSATGGVHNITMMVKSSIKNISDVNLRNETDIPHEAPYYDDAVVGNRVFKPYFGHLGFLKGGTDAGAIASENFTLFTVPDAGTILTIGDVRIGFNTVPMWDCNYTVDIGVINTPQLICDDIENALPIIAGAVTSAGANGDNVLNLQAQFSGYLGNSLLVSVQ